MSSSCFMVQWDLFSCQVAQSSLKWNSSVGLSFPLLFLLLLLLLLLLSFMAFWKSVGYFEEYRSVILWHDHLFGFISWFLLMRLDYAPSAGRPQKRCRVFTVADGRCQVDFIGDINFSTWLRWCLPGSSVKLLLLCF